MTSFGRSRWRFDVTFGNDVIRVVIGDVVILGFERKNGGPFAYNLFHHAAAGLVDAAGGRVVAVPRDALGGRRAEVAVPGSHDRKYGDLWGFDGGGRKPTKGL